MLNRAAPAALVCLALIATACSGSTGSPPASGAAPTSGASGAAGDFGPAEQTKLTVGVDRQALSAFSTFIIGADEGYFKDEGLEVETISTDDPRAAVIGGSIDIASTGAGNTYQGIQEGLDLIAFSGGSCRSAFSFAVAPGITSVAGLDGKDVLLSATAGDPEFYSRKQVLKDGGWDLDTVKPNYVYIPGGSTAWAELFVAGKLFLQPAFSRVRPKLLDYGATIPVDTLKPWPNNVFSVKASWLKDHPETAARFLRAMMKAVAFDLDPANKARIIEIGKAHGFDTAPEEANTSPYWNSQEALCANLHLGAETYDEMLAAQNVQGGLPFDKFADITQLERAQKSLGLDNSPPPEIPWPG